MLDYAIVLCAFITLVLVIVFTFCGWLVYFTGKVESLREVAPILRGLQGILRVWRK